MTVFKPVTIRENDEQQISWRNCEYRESIMGASAEPSSPKWVCIPEITSDSEWFLWNTNQRGRTRFCTGAHDWFYFFHKVFFPVITKTSKITLKSLEITTKGRISQLGVEEIYCPHGYRDWFKITRDNQAMYHLNNIVYTSGSIYTRWIFYGN